MNCEEFKLYMTQNINDINEENLIKLWSVYESFYNYYGDRADFILDLLIFIYKEIGQIDETNIAFLTSIMLCIKNEVYLGCSNQKYLKKIMKNHYLYNKLTDEDKLVCLKFIEDSTRNMIPEEIQYDYICDYYKTYIRKELSIEQLIDILNLDITLRTIYDDTEIDFDDIRSAIIDCYIYNDFDYYKSYNWCLGRITTTHIKDFMYLSYFFEKVFKDTNINKEILDKYFILGCLNDLNYDLENDLNNETVMQGWKYLTVKDNVLLSIAESIENYWFDNMQKEKNYEFIFGIIKKGLNLRYFENDEENNLEDRKNVTFVKFYKLLKRSLDIKYNEINYLWGIYQTISGGDNLDLVGIMCEIYSQMENYNSDKFINIIIELNEANNIFKTYLPTYFDDDVLDMTKKDLFGFIKHSDMEYDEKQCCYKYLNKKINEKVDNYYNEENIANFFHNELSKIYIDDYTNDKIENCERECLKLYNILINFSYLKNIPKYVIKNAILLSHVEYLMNTITFEERLNLCIGLSFYKKTITLEDINNIIYNYYNDKTISDEYKDTYFNYGILCYLEQVEINVNTENKELKDGINYYSYDANNKVILDANNKAIVDIAMNVDDYWHDFNVDKHNKNFQLGILYKGAKDYQDNLLNNGELIEEKQLILKNNNFS